MKTIGLLLLLASVFLVSCATQAKYQAALNTWIGHDVNELVDKWGYPAGSLKAPSGNTVYVYQRGESIPMPTTYQTTASVYGNRNFATGNATTIAYGGGTLDFWCRTYFETNSSHKIIKWRYEGDDCRSK
jgi:hypothetical protein